MNKSELKRNIISSYENATPDVLDNIKSACMGINQVDDEFEPEANTKNRLFWASQVLIAVACMLVIFITGVTVGKNFVKETDTVSDTTQLASALVGESIATIYLDINPSVEVKVDKDMTVVEVNSINEDAKVVVQNLDLKGVKFDVAVNTIVESLDVNGYLKGDTDAILVSVDTKVDGVFDKVTESVNVAVKNKNVDCKVITQVVPDDENLKKLAKEYSVSVGKLMFVEKVVNDTEKYTEADIKELCTFTIKTLNDILLNIGNILSSVVPSQVPNTSANTDNAQPQTPTGNVVTDSVDAANNIAQDSLEGANKAADDAVDGANKVSDDALDTSKKVIDDSLDTAGKIIDNTLGEAGKPAKDAVDGAKKTADTVIDGTKKIVDDALDGTKKVTDDAVKTTEKVVGGVTGAVKDIFKKP